MSTSIPVVLIHGLWIHSNSWQGWMDLYRQAGYDPIAPGWPGDSGSVDETRQNSEAVGDQGLDDITASYIDVIEGLDAKPIVIGHSFGGVVAQKLLADGYAAACIVIDPAQIKGVKAVPLSQIRSGFPVLSKPSNKHKAVVLSQHQFRYAFGNAIPESESDELFNRWAIPGPGKPLFEASTANFKKTSPAAVDTKTDSRGPLLIIGGGSDHTAPESIAKATRKLYGDSNATTDFQSFPDRGHSLVFDHGWREIADYTLAWLKRQGL
ncbi:alpha/beta hydrolase [Micromonospora sp. NPDC049559]|uniref:alpha/beta hydrolase n=1 Tax=Micromonospora sp. NPDC049559 TaxID=3155923 RepID=UPI00341F5D94